MTIPKRMLAVVVLLGVGGCASTFTQAAAVVNGVRLSQSAFERQLAREKAAQQRTGQGLQDDQLSRQVLSRMIQVELVRQEAARKKLSVSATDVDRALDEVKESFPTEQDFQQAMELQGLTLEVLREQLYQTLLADKLSASIAGEITEAQIKTVYDTERARFEQRRARHILIRVDDQSRDTAAKREAERIKTRLEDGESFARLARRFSDDPGSKNAGGSLGVIDERFDATFAAAVAGGKKGEIVGPVRTQFGYHLIRVDSITTRSLEEAAPEIRRGLLSQLRQSVLSEFILEQAPKAAIRVNPRYGDWSIEDAAIIPHQSFIPAPPEVDPNEPRQSPPAELPPGFQPAG